ncbi:toll/interleukin-1 receptor domain-containing protein [Aeromonas hydrophila]|uniref:toll/interleukin-1 receptor domain-containing protein n=1 Tax=Aeromonas hydrophila TaxID=644 RepID=UPI00398838D0
METYEYEVALSFAGEDREYVDKVANLLKENGIRVFYDIFEQTSLWGKDLYTHLADVYQNKAQYTVMFISENYAKNQWTNHERTSAQARAFIENKEYILPVRFDGTNIPGVPATIGYISLNDITPEQLVLFIVEKLSATKEKRENEIKARAFSLVFKNTEFMKAIMSGDEDKALELFAKDENMESILRAMFESGAMD